ncbi:hypothetical protein MCETE7_02181 [Acidimicrobiia bacterium]|jgi:hypothetical protein
MFTTSAATASRSHQGASTRVVAVTSNAYWYTTGTGSFVRFGHKHPARRVLSLT